jgi:hypothetical protein
MAGMEALWNMGPPPGGYSFDQGLSDLAGAQQAAAVNRAAKGGFKPKANETVMGKSDPYAQAQYLQGQYDAPGRDPLDFGNGPSMMPAANQYQHERSRIGGLLGNADLLEGIAAQNRAHASDPRMETANIFGSPTSYMGDPRPPYDYQGALMDRGINPSRQSFVDLYNRGMQPRDLPSEVNPYQGFSQAGNVADLKASPDLSPSEKRQQIQDWGDLGRDTTLALHPVTAPYFAALTAGKLASEVPDQVRAGDLRAAGLSLGGMGLAAAGALPGGKLAKRVAEEAAPYPLAPGRVTTNRMDPGVAVNERGMPQVAMGEGGQPLTRDYTDAMGYSHSDPYFRQAHPGTTLGMFFGPGMHPGADAVIKAGQEAEARGLTPAEGWAASHNFAKEQNLGGPGGWMGAQKLPTGDWMAELDDSQAKFNFKGQPRTLGGVMDHPSLYEKLPGLENTPVRYNAEPQSGWYRPEAHGGPAIGLPFKTNVSTPGILAHEVQHGVAERGGMEGGFNPSFEALKALGGRPDIEAIRQEHIAMAKQRYPEFKDVVTNSVGNKNTAREVYHRSGGENIADLADKRLSMTPEQRGANMPEPRTPWDQQLYGLRETGESASRPAVNRQNFPQFQQQAQATRHQLSNETSADSYRDGLRSMLSNGAVAGKDRTYLAQLHDYAFRPSVSNDYANGMMSAYMRLTGGRVSKSVPIGDLHNAYLDVTKERAAQGGAKAGTEKYTKGDVKSLTTHLYTYGREVGEKFPNTPSHAAPWLIDPKKNTVAFSPYLPPVRSGQ